MAKTERRWLVRYEAGFYGVVTGAHKPRKPKGGWERRRDYLLVDSVGQDAVRLLLPDRFTLPPGGGPVELKG